MPDHQNPRAAGTNVRYGAVAVVLREKKLLAIQRSFTVAAPGAFCFPGGGIEPGETEEIALARELQEELGDMLFRSSVFGAA